MSVNKKAKNNLARKNAEAMKAAKKQQRMAKGSTAVATAPRKGNMKGASLIKQAAKKK